MASRTFDLSGVLLKLDQAKRHIQTVRRETKTFLKGDPAPLGIRTKETPGPGKAIKYVIYADIRQEPPPELALPIGDAIQNIRAALEYLAYELTPPSVRRRIKTEFPIYEDRCQFEVKAKPKIKSLPKDERTLIERVQPYNAWNPPSNDPLAILRNSRTVTNTGSCCRSWPP